MSSPHTRTPHPHRSHAPHIRTTHTHPTSTPYAHTQPTSPPHVRMHPTSAPHEHTYPTPILHARTPCPHCTNVRTHPTSALRALPSHRCMSMCTPSTSWASGLQLFKSSEDGTDVSRPVDMEGWGPRGGGGGAPRRVLVPGPVVVLQLVSWVGVTPLGSAPCLTVQTAQGGDGGPPERHGLFPQLRVTGSSKQAERQLLTGWCWFAKCGCFRTSQSLCTYSGQVDGLRGEGTVTCSPSSWAPCYAGRRSA